MLIQTTSNYWKQCFLQIDSLKKALANKEAAKVASSLKMKENTPISERAKQMVERTPPRSRRLSIENTTNSKVTKSTNPDDRRVPKSPIPMQKMATEYVPIHLRRSSLEGPNLGKTKSGLKVRCHIER